MFDLKGKKTLVTGSSRGIGKSIALAFADAGASVMISSRSQEDCEQVVLEIREKGGVAEACAADMLNPVSVRSLAEATIECFGDVDVFVGNAAVNPAYGPVLATSERDIGQIMEANLLANLSLVRQLAPKMCEKKAGSIILVTSLSALSGSRNIGAYAMSKAAQIQLMKNLALELGRDGIRVNCIAPGLIETDFAVPLHQSVGIRDKYEGLSALGRLGLPDELSGPAVFLASDNASYVTGQVLAVDGGVSVADII